MDWPETADELDRFAPWVIETLARALWDARDRMPEVGCYRLASDNAARALQTAIKAVLAHQERQARLDEHTILAGLDEEGRKRRYFELSGEDPHFDPQQGEL